MGLGVTQRQKKGEKGRFRPISRTGGQTPLKPPFITPPFAAAQYFSATLFFRGFLALWLTRHVTTLLLKCRQGKIASLVMLRARGAKPQDDESPPPALSDSLKTSQLLGSRS